MRESKTNKMINNMKILHTWASFALEKDLHFFEEAHFRNIMEWSQEMIDMLEASKPVRPEKGGYMGRAWGCGRCHEVVGIVGDDPRDQYCRHCGRKVDWTGIDGGTKK